MKQKYLAWVVWLFISCGALRAAPTQVVLVFPLENLSGDSSLGWMSEGIADLLSSRLSSSQGHVLQYDERNAGYRELGLSPGMSLTLASEYKVAQMLGASLAVVGNFTVSKDQLTTRVRCLDVAGLSLSRPITVSGKMADLADLETRLAWRLVSSCCQDVAHSTEQDFSDRFPPVRLGAFENYIRGILATDPQSRVHFLRESDRLNPNDHRAALELGRFYFEQKDYADSALWLQKVDTGDADYFEGLFLLGIDEYSLGRDGLAQAVFETLLRRIPLAEVLNNLGVVQIRLGHNGEAWVNLNHAAQKDPTDPDILFNLSVCSWDMKKYNQAEELLRSILARDPDDVGTHTFLDHVSGKLGGNPAAESEPTRIADKGENAKHDPVNANQTTAQYEPEPRIKATYDGKAYRLLALAIRRSTESRRSTEPAQVIESESQAQTKRAGEFLAAGWLLDAEQALTEALSLAPKNTDALQLLGQVYEMEGKHTLAAEDLQTCLEEKDSAVAHFWLARAYVSLSHPRAAMQQAQAALKLDPANAEVKQLIDRIRAQISSNRDEP